MYYFIVTAIEILKFYFIFRFGFEVKERKIFRIVERVDVRVILEIMIWIITGICMLIKPEIEHSFLFYISWIFIEVILLCQYDYLSLIVMTICSMFLIGNLDMIFSTSIRIVAMQAGLLVGDKSIVVLSSFITLAFLVGIIFFIPRKNNGHLKQIGIKYFIFVLGISFANNLVVSLLWEFILNKNFGDNSSTLIIVYIVIFFGILMQISLILKLAVANNVYSEKDQMNKYYLKLQEERFLYLEEKERETKKFRHDVRQHMYMIGSLCKEGNLTELEEYVEEMHVKIEKISNGIVVNNGVVETVLNQVYILCKKKNINFIVKGHIPTECNIELFDLCTIFSNLMQNAYEAASECEQGVIRVTIRYDENVICIKEENTFIKEREKEGQNLITNKRDKDNHGFGVINITECIKKYNGTLKHEIIRDDFKQMWFVAYIMMAHVEKKKEQKINKKYETNK